MKENISINQFINIEKIGCSKTQCNIELEKCSGLLKHDRFIWQYIQDRVYLLWNMGKLSAWLGWSHVSLKDTRSQVICYLFHFDLYEFWNLTG